MWDDIESEKAKAMSVDWWRRAKAAKDAAGKIEKYLRPSLKPGIAKENGGTRGASPTQIKTWGTFWENFHSESPSRKRIIAISGSNQSGKTACAYAAWCLYLRDFAPSGSIHWLIAASIDSIKGVPLRTLWQLLPRSMFGSWHYHPQSNLPTTIPLHLPDGRGVIELKPMTENQDLQEFEQERLSSWLWSECRREAVFGALQPRMVAHGAFGIMDYIPIEPWHRDIEENARVPGGMIHHVRMAIIENQHNLAPGAVHDMKPKALGGRGTMSVEEWKLRGEGRPAAYEGVVYKQFEPDRDGKPHHVIPPFTIHPLWPLYVFGDWGYRNPHAIGLGTVAPNEAKYVIDEEYGPETTVFDVCKRMWVKVSSWRTMHPYAGMTVDEMFLRLRNEMNQSKAAEGRTPTPIRDHIRREWKRVLAAPWVMDASIFDRDQADGTALSDEFELCGVPVAASIKANKDGGVELVRRNWEQMRVFFFAACTHFRREHATWRFKENKDRIPDPDDKYERKNDHCPAALMYWLRSGPCYSPATGGVVSVQAP
jgi:hypothetical protein